MLCRLMDDKAFEEKTLGPFFELFIEHLPEPIQGEFLAELKGRHSSMKSKDAVFRHFTNKNQDKQSHWMENIALMKVAIESITLPRMMKRNETYDCEQIEMALVAHKYLGLSEDKQNKFRGSLSEEEKTLIWGKGTEESMRESFCKYLGLSGDNQDRDIDSLSDEEKTFIRGKITADRGKITAERLEAAREGFYTHNRTANEARAEREHAASIKDAVAEIRVLTSPQGILLYVQRIVDEESDLHRLTLQAALAPIVRVMMQNDLAFAESIVASVGSLEEEVDDTRSPAKRQE